MKLSGLVKGASKGEGLGNKFLSHIREVDAIIHMIRCFDSDDIQNVNPTVDPIRDLEIIETEMMLADLESIQKRLEKNNKNIENIKKQLQQSSQDNKDLLNTPISKINRNILEKINLKNFYNEMEIDDEGESGNQGNNSNNGKNNKFFSQGNSSFLDAIATKEIPNIEKFTNYSNAVVIDWNSVNNTFPELNLTTNKYYLKWSPNSFTIFIISFFS